MIKQILDSRYSVLIYYAVFSLFIFFYAQSFPHYNWDILGYVGSVKNFEIQSKESLHEYVFSNAKESIPSERFEYLVGSLSTDTDEDSDMHYRQEMSNNAEAFYQQLPFYQIRIIYISLIKLATEFGVNIFTATYLISTISVILGLWVLLFTFRPYIHNYLLYALPAFGLAFGITDVASLSTPDGLAFLTITVITCLLTRRSRFILIMLPLSIFVRTDLIIYMIIIAVYILIFNKSWRFYTAASIVACFLSYYFVNQYYGHYGWLTVFYFTFIESISHPANFKVQMSVEQFLSSFKIVTITKPIVFYITITILSLFLLSKYHLKNIYHEKLLNLMCFIALSSFLYIAIHFLLYPDLWSRFFLSQYVLGSAVFLYLLSNHDQIKRHHKD